MTVALVNDEARLLNSLNRVVQLAPCVINESATEDNIDGIGALTGIGIYSLPTFNWEVDK